MDLLHTVSDLALRHLPDRLFTTMRSAYFATRKKMYPIARYIHGSFDTAALRSHLEERLDPNFEILMVHSSVNHMLPYYQGNPLELLKMLMEFCGKERTLVMPAFYFGNARFKSLHEEFRSNPEINLKKVPSQMGLMTELFRRTKGVIQSRHPVYRVSALGPLAGQLVTGHENAYRPAGAGSPFEYMAKHDTMVIGIGKSFHVMTQVHHVDDIMGDDFPVPRNHPDGGATKVTVIDGDSKVVVNLPQGVIQGRFNMEKLPSLLDKGELVYWKFHNVPLFSGRAKEVTEKLLTAAKQGKTLYDPK